MPARATSYCEEESVLSSCQRCFPDDTHDRYARPSARIKLQRPSAEAATCDYIC